MLWSSVLEAAKEGNLDSVKSLLDQWRSDDSLAGPTAHHLRWTLIEAAQSNHSTLVSYLLEHGAEIDPVVLSNAAAKKSSAAVWQAFLDHGWDINKSDCSTGSPVLLHLVDNESLVKWFLDHGSDPNVHNAKDECPLDVAARICNIPVVELLLQRGAKIECSSALHAAARTGRADSEAFPVMAYLLDHGADINALEHQGSPEYFERMKMERRHAFGTALHSATFSRKKERVRFLLERGADRDVLNTQGGTVAGSIREDDEESGIDALLENR